MNVQDLYNLLDNFMAMRAVDKFVLIGVDYLFPLLFFRFADLVTHKTQFKHNKVKAP